MDGSILDTEGRLQSHARTVETRISFMASYLIIDQLCSSCTVRKTKMWEKNGKEKIKIKFIRPYSHWTMGQLPIQTFVGVVIFILESNPSLNRGKNFDYYINMSFFRICLVHVF